MELAGITLYKTIVMAMLALVGVVCYQKKIVDEKVNQALSDLVLTVFTPVLLFTSFQTDYDKTLMKGLLTAVVFSLISFGVMWLIGKAVTRRHEKDDACVEQIAVLYSNCGFIGIPMAQGIFGADGVLYMTAYVAVANFLLWTHGVIVMSGKADLRSVRKVFCSPTILAILAGVLCFLIQIRIPGMVEEPLEMIASMNTPMAMIVAGIQIAQTDLKRIAGEIRLYWMCVVRTLIMPGILIILFRVLPGDELVKLVMILASACPSGVTGTLFALRYGKNAVYASGIFAVSTIVSIVTIPFMMLLCG